ncbi:MAG: hypothetical protein JXN60_02585 [Lentisphaerae bacterium]|nr:hypothetical protein [Lentisphaerota bacterium]
MNNEAKTANPYTAGWNLISETINNQTSTLTNYFVCGLDLSGTLQGAGGIGGLLATVQSGATYFSTFDDNGTVVAHREYSPFGETVVSTGDKENDFSFWFSTKYTDAETGLYYYGYRYYSPELGRWPSRNPWWESGFQTGVRRHIDALDLETDLNVYVLAGNSPNDRYDYIGGSFWCYCGVSPAIPGIAIPPGYIPADCGASTVGRYTHRDATGDCGYYYLKCLCDGKTCTRRIQYQCKRVPFPDGSIRIRWVVDSSWLHKDCS